jgi:predicted enzyme related to lactoylglutathione lyase
MSTIDITDRIDTAMTVIFAVTVELATLWAALSIRRPTTRLAVVVPSAFLLGAVQWFFVRAMLQLDLADMIIYSSILGLQATIAALSLLVIRSCGWRLVRGSALTLLVLKSRQVDLLRAFYGTFGITLAEEQHGKGAIHYTGKIGELVFEVYPLADGGAQVDATTRLGIAVADLTDVVEELQASGSPVVEQPKTTAWGQRAVVRDPDGRTVELYQC